MLPEQLTAEDFRSYPPEARRVAASQVALLRRLPLSFLPLLLRELILFDWKFPAERRDLQKQFSYLSGLAPAEFAQTNAAFAKLQLSPELQTTDWITAPATFSERLAAHLWATHQIDAFRSAAVDYINRSSGALPDAPLSTHRLGIAVIGRDSGDVAYPLFRKLNAHGSLFTKVQHDAGVKTLLDAVAKRAGAHSEPYAHWYIDGGSIAGSSIGENTVAGVTTISYPALAAARAALQSRMQKTYENGAFDPEAFRSMLARTQPEEIGLAGTGDAVVSRFELSVLTEGSGTQVFSTTFVQWAAREALRRAQPLTLLARFAPRQRERPMNELLAESQRVPELDPKGSLIDADLGAYYTWVNQQRLAGADNSAFLAWHEDREQAVVVAPSFEKDRRVNTPTKLTELIQQIS